MMAIPGLCSMGELGLLIVTLLGSNRWTLKVCSAYERTGKIGLASYVKFGQIVAKLPSSISRYVALGFDVQIDVQYPLVMAPYRRAQCTVFVLF